MVGAALYVLIVSVFVGAAAWLAERILASLRRPRRWVWLVAMSLSVAIPAWRLPAALPDLSLVQVMPPSASVDAGQRSTASNTRRAVAPPATTVSAAAPARRTRPDSQESPPRRRIWTAAAYQRVLLAFLVGWGLVSAALLVRLAGAVTTLRRRARGWTVTELDGLEVTVADDLGPAVLGVLRPRIIVPQWLAQEPAERRVAVLAHEREHLRAYDGRALFAGWLVVVLAPWNLPVWWFYRRLRQAIEVDCDARVVRRGVPVATYGEALLSVATRAPAALQPAIGLFERRSQLERRLRILVTPSRRWVRWAALPLYALTGLAALAAGTFPAPPIDAALGARNQARQDAILEADQLALDARVTRRLLASGRPDALAAAAILGWPSPESSGTGPRGPGAPANARQRLTWLAHAVAEAPGRPDLVAMEAAFCRQWKRHCDIATLEARLRVLAPHNGGDWLEALQTSVERKDSAAVDAALAAIGRRRYVDSYDTRLRARLSEALHRIGREDFMTAYFQVANPLDSAPLDGVLAFAQACHTRTSRLTARRLSLCRAASLAFEHGDSFLTAATGSSMAAHLWPAGTREQRQAARLQRRLDYLQAQQTRLFAARSGLQGLLMLLDARGEFERAEARSVHLGIRYRREQDVLRTELIDAGLRVQPPPGWKDPYDLSR